MARRTALDFPHRIDLEELGKSASCVVVFAEPPNKAAQRALVKGAPRSLAATTWGGPVLYLETVGDELEAETEAKVRADVVGWLARTHAEQAITVAWFSTGTGSRPRPDPAFATAMLDAAERVTGDIAPFVRDLFRRVRDELPAKLAPRADQVLGVVPDEATATAIATIATSPTPPTWLPSAKVTALANALAATVARAPKKVTRAAWSIHVEDPSAPPAYFAGAKMWLQGGKPIEQPKSVVAATKALFAGTLATITVVLTRSAKGWDLAYRAVAAKEASALARERRPLAKTLHAAIAGLAKPDELLVLDVQLDPLRVGMTELVALQTQERRVTMPAALRSTVDDFLSWHHERGAAVVRLIASSKPDSQVHVTLA